jgi:hypothetical protein
MKKLLTITIAFLLILNFQNTYAQSHFAFGGRAGINLANLSFDPDIQSGLSKSTRVGFKFGAVGEIGFIPMIALRFEPMYSMGGCVVDNVQFGTVKGKITFKLSYLEIPILLKFNIPVPGSISPYVFAGPNLGLILSNNELDEAGGQSAESDLKDQTSSINFGLDFGAGVGFKVVPLTTIIFDIRYSLGLSNLLNDKGKQSWGANQTIKTTGIQIVAGVIFGL